MEFGSASHLEMTTNISNANSVI